MGKKSKKTNKKLMKQLAAQWSQTGTMGSAGTQAQGWLGKLQASGSQQFLLGAALGATAAYILSNDEMREKIIRSAVRLYCDVSGGMAELKEQVADMQAELQAQEVSQDE
ncbi:hypothetical protein ABKY47_004550 [Aeromonas hydrophila]